MQIRVQPQDFDIAAETRAMREPRRDIGAIASFTGLVRDLSDNQDLLALELEHYPGMTEKALQDIAAQAQQRWDIQDLTIVHRVGSLQPGDNIVLVLVASAHRHDAFAACEFLMDYLKTRAPFWKKEISKHGEHWVESRHSDQAAAQRWKQDS